MAGNDPKRTVRDFKRQHQIVRNRLLILVLFPLLLCLESCESSEDDAVAHAVTTSELTNVRNSLRVWRELQNQQIEEESLYQLVAQNIVSQVLMIRAVGFNVEELKGNSLEALCLLTTEEVKGIMSSAEHKELSLMAVGYIEDIEDDVLKYFYSVQESMLGSGCSLSPGEPHY